MSRVTRWVVGLVFLAVGAAVLATRWWLPNAPEPERGIDTPEVARDPRWTYDSPFLNVRPDVQYVGDSVCAECHHDIAKHYRHHPMGRALAPVKLDDSGVGVQFERNGYRYSILARDGQVFHAEERLASNGGVAARVERPVRYTLGSGTRGRAFLIVEDGRVFTSPISWYRQTGDWDLAPEHPEHLHFSRPIVAGCLICHSNRVEPVEGTVNTYEQPVFRGDGIGCERCHGPGELHVKRHESGERVRLPDDSIVNPAHLEPKLAAAICQQCHLKGEERVLAEGRHPFDFRPGLPLELFWTVFVRPAELRASYRTVSQVEQMQVSRCFQGSGGRLGCTSCHDPHRQPTAGERVEFYRSRCQSCHDQGGCSLAGDERRRRQPDDSCIACHMSKEGSSNILHVAVTDHRILRHPDPGNVQAIRPLAPGESPLRPFAEIPENRLRRDLGIALARIATADPQRLETLSRMSLERLIPATRERPDDLAAWEARAEAHRRLGQIEEAIAALEHVRTRRPRSETALTELAELYESQSKLAAAVDTWRAAVEINPDAPSYRIGLARVLARLGRWSEALQVADEMIALEPVNPEAKVLRVSCLLRLGETPRAKEELERVLALRPVNEAELRRRFADLLR